MFSNRISIRIAAWYTIAFLIGSFILFALTGYFLNVSLQEKDRELLAVKLQDLGVLFEKEGLEGLQTRVVSQKASDVRNFFVRLSGDNEKTLFLYAPTDAHDDWPSLQEIDRVMQEKARKTPWLSIPGPGGYGDSVELISKVLPSGEVLQVGKDTEDRETFMESYARAFFFSWIPVLILAVLAGIYFSTKLLAPIRWLTQTVQSIRSGEGSARVPLKKNTNELHQLGMLVNEMLDQNEKLIQGMKGTLDHVAHDLRTPLTRLQLSAELALTAENGSADSYKEALIESKENADAILKILNAIMAISEAETGTLPLHIEQVSLNTLVDHIIDFYEFVAEGKQIQLSTHGLERNVQVHGDEARLMQSLANLVDNAIKYSPAGSVVQLHVGEDGDMGFLEVRDQGMGISEEDKPRIWDRLYRGDKSRSTRGLGLGLSLVQAIAQAHHGKVEILSQKEPGSTFRFSLPRHFTSGGTE